MSTGRSSTKAAEGRAWPPGSLHQQSGRILMPHLETARSASANAPPSRVCSSKSSSTAFFLREAGFPLSSGGRDPHELEQREVGRDDSRPCQPRRTARRTTAGGTLTSGEELCEEWSVDNWPLWVATRRPPTGSGWHNPATRGGPPSAHADGRSARSSFIKSRDHGFARPAARAGSRARRRARRPRSRGCARARR